MRRKPCRKFHPSAGRSDRGEAVTIHQAIFADWLVPRGGQKYDLRAWALDLQVLRECGVDRVVLGLGRRHYLLPAARYGDVLAACDASYDYGIEPWVMAWAVRSKAWLAGDLPRFVEVADYAHAAGVVLDCERGWHRGTVDAEEAAEQAGGAIGSCLPWAVTGLAQCQPSVQPLARLAPVVIPQAYSVWQLGDTAGGRRPIRSDAPPRCQIRAWQSWSSHVTDPRSIDLGLGCYWLARPGMAREACLTGQLLAAEHAGCNRVWWWSLKWLRAQRWAQTILRGYSGVTC